MCPGELLGYSTATEPANTHLWSKSILSRAKDQLETPLDDKTPLYLVCVTTNACNSLYPKIEGVKLVLAIRTR